MCPTEGLSKPKIRLFSTRILTLTGCIALVVAFVIYYRMFMWGVPPTSELLASSLVGETSDRIEVVYSGSSLGPGRLKIHFVESPRSKGLFFMERTNSLYSEVMNSSPDSVELVLNKGSVTAVLWQQKGITVEADTIYVQHEF